MATPEYNRLFAVGCSYTQYAFPTYADILGLNFHKYVNLGKSGGGNKYIFNTLCYVFNELQPKEGDVVIAQWSGIARYDTIFNDQVYWETPGNLNWQQVYPYKWVDDFFNICQAGYEYISYITAINALAKQSKATFINFNMFDPWVGMYFGEPFQTNIFHKRLTYINRYYPKELMKETCKQLNFPTSVEEYQWITGPYEQPYIFDVNPRELQQDNLPPGVSTDTHPTTKGHYAYAKYINELYNLGCDYMYSDTVVEQIEKIHTDQTDKNFSFQKSRSDKMYDKYSNYSVSVDINHLYWKAKSKGLPLVMGHTINNHGYSNDQIKKWLRQ